MRRPGPAGRPVAIVFAFATSAVSKPGASKLFELIGRVAHHRGLPVDQLLFDMSIENFSAAIAVRLPLRVCSM
jgi:hypothetical protein